MTDPKVCTHLTIRPLSGGYYLECAECRTLWVHKRPGAEEQWAPYNGRQMMDTAWTREFDWWATKRAR